MPWIPSGLTKTWKAPKERNFVANATRELGLPDRRKILYRPLPQWREYRLIKLAKTLRENKEQAWTELEGLIDMVFNQIEPGVDAQYPSSYRPHCERHDRPIWQWVLQHDGRLSMDETNDLLIESEHLIFDQCVTTTNHADSRSKMIRRAHADLRDWFHGQQPVYDLPQLPPFPPLHHHPAMYPHGAMPHHAMPMPQYGQYPMPYQMPMPYDPYADPYASYAQGYVHGGFPPHAPY